MIKYFYFLLQGKSEEGWGDVGLGAPPSPFLPSLRREPEATRSLAQSEQSKWKVSPLATPRNDILFHTQGDASRKGQGRGGEGGRAGTTFPKRKLQINPRCAGRSETVLRLFGPLIITRRESPSAIAPAVLFLYFDEIFPLFYLFIY